MTFPTIANRAKLLVMLAVLLLVSACRSADPDTRPDGMFYWIPGVGQVDAPRIDVGPGKGAQERISRTLAGAGAGMVIGGAIMLAIPGVRQWGGTTALSGIALAWLAIAFGHPLVPLLGFVFLVALAGWKIYKRVIMPNVSAK